MMQHMSGVTPQMAGDFFDVGLGNDDLDRTARMVQWNKIHRWLRGHAEWKEGSDLDHLCAAVYDLSYDADECFLELTIYADKNHLNDSATNRALLLRLAGHKYKDRPLGFPTILSLNISPGQECSPEHISNQQGKPSPDITHVDIAPNAKDTWL